MDAKAAAKPNDGQDNGACLSAAEIAAWRPAPVKGGDSAAAQAAAGEALWDVLARHGHGGPEQTGGRHWPVGCVSLEITQRCNLDCTLCYLSDMSEAVQDIPLAEIFHRIEDIAHRYGPGTNVQVSGGDPTLREREELIAIVARLAERGMSASLLTNGIKASRDLLRDLAHAGLKDVAFHVDLTQERKGFSSEAALNAVRDDYIARARGLGLRILFNTTVHDDNVAEMPDLVRYFISRADDLHMVSFQLQADTGRGVKRAREEGVSAGRMMDDIKAGTGAALDFDMPLIGHPECNRYSAVLVSDGLAVPFFEPKAFWRKLFQAATKHAAHWRARRNWRGLAAMIAERPGLALQGFAHGLKALWVMRRGLIKTGKVTKLSFLVHNFMDAASLDRGRCESCIFMVATRDGPMSMCVHNAKRDTELLKPIRMEKGWWDPLTGTIKPHAANADAAPEALPLKRLKGRRRAAALKLRRADAGTTQPS